MAGEPGWMGTFEGRDEVMGYVNGFVRQFGSTTWVDERWTESADGRTVFVEARGDAVMEHSGEPYHDLDVQRFDVEGVGMLDDVGEYLHRHDERRALERGGQRGRQASPLVDLGPGS